MATTVELVGVPDPDLAPGSAPYWCVQVGQELRHYVPMRDVAGCPTMRFWCAGRCDEFDHPHHKR
jgi:hypothetical protein